MHTGMKTCLYTVQSWLRTSFSCSILPSIFWRSFPMATLLVIEHWVNYLIGLNFRRTKFRGTNSKFLAFLSAENILSVLSFKMNLILIWYDLMVQGIFLILADKIFGGQKFSVDKHFRQQARFSELFPPKLCQMR